MPPSLPTVYVPNELSKHLRRGHPWLYRDRLSKPVREPSGTWVQVRCGKFTGYGLWDKNSPIAVRLFSQNRVPDARWVSERIQDAWTARAALREAGQTAYRWLYGAGDGLPGLVADLYNDYVVVETYADSLESLLPWVVAGLRACMPLKGVLWKRGEVRSLWGRTPVRELVVEENGLRFYVDLLSGQKTGLFLDQRDNRAYLEQWCAGKRVINCFAYTGAFSLYAVRGGAREVTSVDIAAPAVEAIGRNMALNGYDEDAHPAIVADCFDLLEQYAKRGEQFDLVILDPPSLGRSRKHRRSALRAYERLNRFALECLSPGGLLATASCTSQVSPSDFTGMLGNAASRAGRRIRILHEAGHALDHPVPAHFPEGRYLKFVVGSVQGVV